MFDGLKDLMGGLVDKEQVTKDTITDALEKVAEELNVPFSSLFIMIKPINAEFGFRCDIYKLVDNKPVHVREITVAEIVGVQKE